MKTGEAWAMRQFFMARRVSRLLVVILLSGLVCVSGVDGGRLLAAPQGGPLPEPNVPPPPPPAQGPVPPVRIQEPTLPMPRPPLPGLPGLPSPGLPGDMSGSGRGTAPAGSPAPGGSHPGRGTPGTGAPGSGSSGGNAGGSGAPPSSGAPSGKRQPAFGKRRKKSSPADDYLKVIAEAQFALWGKRVHEMLRTTLGPFLRRQMQLLLAPFQTLGWLVLAFMFLAALITMANENQSAAGLGGLLMRGVFCAFLVGWSGPLVDRMTRMGTFWIPADAGSFQQVAQTTPAGPVRSTGGGATNVVLDHGRGVLTGLVRWRDSEAQRYFEGYEALVKHGFKVDVQGSQVWQAYRPDLKFVIPAFGPDGRETAWEYTRRLNLSSWSPSNLLALLNGSVTVMHLGMMFSTVLTVFLLLAFKLLAPVFFGIAIHKKFSQQLTGPFVRGLLVATLLLPTINLLLEGLSYSIGRLGFAPFYLQQGGQWQPAVTWDDASLSFVGDFRPIAPYLFVASFLTAVAGLCMILSPVIAYKIAQGEWFSSAVGSVSGWTAGLIGIGMAAFSTSVGALFQREAEHLQNVGATAQRQAEAKAGQVMGLAENEIRKKQAYAAAAQQFMSSVSRTASKEGFYGGGLLVNLGMKYMNYNHPEYQRGYSFGDLIGTRLATLLDDDPSNDIGFRELNDLNYLAQTNTRNSPLFGVGLQMGLLARSNRVGVSVANWAYETRRNAIDQAAALRMGGAAQNLHYAQLASQKQALGQYLSRMGDDINTVLTEQIENNNRS